MSADFMIIVWNSTVLRANEVEKKKYFKCWFCSSFVFVWARLEIHSILIINIIMLEYVPIDSRHKMVKNHKLLPLLLLTVMVMMMIKNISSFLRSSSATLSRNNFLTVPSLSNVCQCANFFFERHMNEISCMKILAVKWLHAVRSNCYSISVPCLHCYFD